MKRTLIWFLMLWKRLLMKKGFLVILALIPITALLMTLSVGEENGLMNVAVVVDSEADGMARDFMARLEHDSDTFRYTFCKDESEVIEMVESGEADSGWVVPGELEKAVNKYAERLKGKIVTVYQREENVFLKLSREKIYCTLYPYISMVLYRDYITEDFMPEISFSEGEIEDAYMIFDTDQTLIDYRYEDGIEEKMVNTNYLTSPIRGIAVVLMLLLGLASVMYFIGDEEAKTFSLVRRSHRVWIMAGGCLAALITAGVFVTLALVISGNYTDIMTESVGMAAYILCTCGFCTLLGSIICDIRIFGLLLPVVTVVCLGLCPVFMNLRIAAGVQILLPPYHYLIAVFNSRSILYMLIYTAIAIALACPIYNITRKQMD